MMILTNKKFWLLSFLVIFLVLGIFLIYNNVRERDVINQGINDNADRTQTTPIVEEGENVEFPEDFPSYPDSTIEDKWVRDSQNTTGKSFVFYTEDSMDDVYDFYINRVESSGWQILDSDMDNYILNVLKNNRQGYLVLSESETGETLISITFAEIKR